MIGPTVQLDLSQPGKKVTLPVDTRDAHLLVLWDQQPITLLPISQAPATIDQSFVWRLLQPKHVHRIRRAQQAHPQSSPNGIPPSSVTVAVCTRNRPEALQRCVVALASLDPAPAEILIVDSASTDPEVRAVVEAAGVGRYIREEKKGASIARNTALREASTEWVAFTDDDVETSPGWVGAIASAAGAGSTCITGPVIPKAIPNRAAELFESYGGLNRGFQPKEWDRSFVRGGLRGGLKSPPLWDLGAGASMALHRQSAIRAGGFDPLLGAGVAAGCSEDSDLCYRMLRQGGRIRYEPGAWVLHTHRATMTELRYQLFAYGRGHTAAQWKACLLYRDIRGLGRILLGLPLAHLRRLTRTAIGRSRFPARLILSEALGNLLGPFSWRPTRRPSFQPSPRPR